MQKVSTLLEDFEDWLTEKRRPQVGASTARIYRRHAAKFCEHYGHPSALDKRMLLDWEQSIQTYTKGGKSRKASPATVNVKIAAIRALFDYLLQLGIQTVDLSQNLSMQRVPDRLPRPIDEKVIEDLFRLIQENEDEIATQDLAMFEVLYGSGLRRSEAALLTLKNIDTKRTLTLVGKGDKERRTPLTTPGYLAIRDWVLSKNADGKTQKLLESLDADAAFTDLKKRKPDLPIFVTTQGTPLRDLKCPGDFIYQRTEFYTKQIGEKFSPHQLRHSWFTYLLNNGADIYIVSQAGGHKKLDTTKIYTKVMDKGLNSLRAAHPRERSEAYVE